MTCSHEGETQSWGRAGVGWGPGPGSGAQKWGDCWDTFHCSAKPRLLQTRGVSTAAKPSTRAFCARLETNPAVKAPAIQGGAGAGCPKAHGMELGAPEPQAGEQREVRWTQRARRAQPRAPLTSGVRPGGRSRLIPCRGHIRLGVCRGSWEGRFPGWQLGHNCQRR